ncbi:MAG: tRNA (adenosine(37)-N6)-threonylcarbamoyltransferase complex ATPase subunit type 1 TsaE [Candidatus Flexifilum sp.]
MPILKEGELDIISSSPEQTLRLGIRLGALLRPGDIVCLSGDLGAGKTVFARGIGQGWGAVPPLVSPTFTLVHVHTRQQDAQRLYHLDCYRLSGPEDLDSIGFEDILTGQGPVLIEWPERILAALPTDRLWVDISMIEPTRRNLVFEATGPHAEQILTAFRGAALGGR